MDLQKIEDRIERLIGETGNQELMDAWIELLEAKKAQMQKILDHLERKDPVLLVAIGGAVLGHIMKRD